MQSQGQSQGRPQGKSGILPALLLFLAACGGEDSAPPPVVVAPVAVQSVSFGTSAIELLDDLNATALNVTVAPANADTSRLTIASSDPAVFTIDAQRNLTAVAAGTANVVVSNNGAQIATLPVTVRNVRLYSIGNSHTWDFRPYGDFLTLAGTLGISIENDWHIHCGSSLARILIEPDQTCVASQHGNFEVALAEVAYDIVTIQTFPGEVSGRDEAQAVIDMVARIRQSKSRDARIFVYFSWPTNLAPDLVSMDYAAMWESADITPDSLFPTTAAFVAHVRERLAAENVQVSGIIPTGAAFNSFHKRAAAGQIAGFQGAGQLYRDLGHVNNIGSFAASASVLYSIFPGADLLQTDLNAIPGFAPKATDPTDRQWDEATRRAIISVVRDEVDASAIR